MVDAASQADSPDQSKASRPRWARRLAFVLVFAIALAAALGTGAKVFLGSQQFKSMLADRLQTAFNGRLRFGDVDVGLNSTSMHDLELMEKGSEEPWAKIGHVEAKMPLQKLLTGSADAEQIVLHKTDVTLRFDADNHLLTALPERQGPLPPLPPVHLDAGTLTLAQEGRAPFRLANLAGVATTKDGKLTFTGTVKDPTWGEWTVTIAYDPETAVSQMNLKSSGVHVKQAMLAALPFVSAKVWKHVECDGNTRADVTFRKDPGREHIHYEVVLDPDETAVRVPSIDLQAHHASGHVVIEDRLVTLTNVTGQTADGQIQTTATLDFRRPLYEHRFAIDARKLDLHLLPAKWKIPSTLRGRLSGHADLLVKVGDGKPETTGGGEGIVDQARLALVQFNKPIRIRLVADRKGFHFLPLLPEFKDPGPAR